MKKKIERITEHAFVEPWCGSDLCDYRQEVGAKKCLRAELEHEWTVGKPEANPQPGKEPLV